MSWQTPSQASKWYNTSCAWLWCELINGHGKEVLPVTRDPGQQWLTGDKVADTQGRCITYWLWFTPPLSNEWQQFRIKSPLALQEWRLCSGEMKAAASGPQISDAMLLGKVFFWPLWHFVDNTVYCSFYSRHSCSDLFRCLGKISIWQFLAALNFKIRAATHECQFVKILIFKDFHILNI